MLSVIIACGLIGYVTGMIVDQSLPPLNKQIPTSEGIMSTKTSPWLANHGTKSNDNNFQYRYGNHVKMLDYHFDAVLKYTKESLESGRINNSSDFSCFDDSESFNYLDMSSTDISAIRQFVVAQKSDVTFIRKNIQNNQGHLKKYKEIDADLVKIETKECRKCVKRSFHWREIFYNINRGKVKKDCYLVTSEKYL